MLNDLWRVSCEGQYFVLGGGREVRGRGVYDTLALNALGTASPLVRTNYVGFVWDIICGSKRVKQFTDRGKPQHSKRRSVAAIPANMRPTR